MNNTQSSVNNATPSVLTEQTPPPPKLTLKEAVARFIDDGWQLVDTLTIKQPFQYSRMKRTAPTDDIRMYLRTTHNLHSLTVVRASLFTHFYPVDHFFALVNTTMIDQLVTGVNKVIAESKCSAFVRRFSVLYILILLSLEGQVDVRQ